MPSTCRRAFSCARIPSRSPDPSSGRRNAAAGARPTRSVRPCPCSPSTSIVRARSSRATGASSGAGERRAASRLSPAAIRLMMGQRPPADRLDRFRSNTGDITTRTSTTVYRLSRFRFRTPLVRSANRRNVGSTTMRPRRLATGIIAIGHAQFATDRKIGTFPLRHVRVAAGVQGGDDDHSVGSGER